jgi:hypothetical protein
MSIGDKGKNVLALDGAGSYSTYSTVACSVVHEAHPTVGPATMLYIP